MSSKQRLTFDSPVGTITTKPLDTPKAQALAAEAKQAGAKNVTLTPAE